MLRVELTDGADGASDETYRLTRTAGGLVLRSAHPAGAATGLYAVADRIRSGDDVLPAGQDGKVNTLRLGLRLLDTGSVGLPDDPAGFCTLYPPTEQCALEMLRRLAEDLSGISGPFVLSDRRFETSECVSYRYGAFRGDVRIDGRRRPR